MHRQESVCKIDNNHVTCSLNAIEIRDMGQSIQEWTKWNFFKGCLPQILLWSILEYFVPHVIMYFNNNLLFKYYILWKQQFYSYRNTNLMYFFTILVLLLSIWVKVAGVNKNINFILLKMIIDGTHSAFTCSKSRMKTPEQCVKSVQN